ncbi:hypothetical protein FOA52_009283 [Chlamydomonas sp. UWO 241]|nr:hypothetical protein FOA52_009283 [Chlamydomonas sp. UWO 241]
MESVDGGEAHQRDGVLGQAYLAAAAAGNMEALSAALDAGVDVSYQDPATGMSALMKAADGAHAPALAALLQAGCPWNLQDHEGYTAGEYGMHAPEVLDMLVGWGVEAELVLGDPARTAAGGSGNQPAAESSSGAQSSEAYLQQRLVYSEDGTKLLDADGEAVMMGWEGPLMRHHAELICGPGGRDVMNVGFGLGLVDEYIQSHSPRTHIIIEAHPDVYAHALAKGWGTRPGVRLMFGRWQEVLPQLLAEGVQLDGVFWDTYAEYYADMRGFHDALPRLMRPGGIYSFFNGLAPDNIFFHMVYSRLVQLELSKLGFATTYAPIKIEEALAPEVWAGVKNKYWHFSTYFLPECTLAGAAPAAAPAAAAAGQ